MAEMDFGLLKTVLELAAERHEASQIHAALEECMVSDDDRFFAWLHDIEPTIENIGEKERHHANDDTQLDTQRVGRGGELHAR